MDLIINACKDDLEIGYIVKFRNGELRMVTLDIHNQIVLVNGRDYWWLSYYNDDLSFYDPSHIIDEIYGRSKDHYALLEVSLHKRKLLWKRGEMQKVKMSLIEVERHLGYQIELV